MKYTKYFINGEYIDIDALNTIPKTLFLFIILGALAGLIFGIIMIPIAITLDGFRGIKYVTIKLERKHQLIKKFKNL